MALIENFDVDFEDYIIFHRGIAEVDVKDDNHLHVIYQDGYDQDLGDRYGDEARQYLEKTNAAKEAAEEAQENAEAYSRTAQGYATQAERTKSAIEDKLTDAETIEASLSSAMEDLRAAKQQASEAVDQVNGYVTQAKEAAQAAQTTSNSIVYEAQAWAEGKRGDHVITAEDDDPAYQNNAKYYANTVEIRSEVWATGQMNGVDVPDSDDRSAPDINNNAKYYKVKADENRARAASYAVGGSQTYQGMNNTYIGFEPDETTWIDSAGNETMVEMSAKKFAELAKQEASYSAERATTANNILTEVNNVAQEYVKPLDRLEGITRDEETGNYSIDTISNEAIDLQVVLLFPGSVSAIEFYRMTKDIDIFADLDPSAPDPYISDVISRYQEAYVKMKAQSMSEELSEEELEVLNSDMQFIHDWFSEHVPIYIFEQPQDQTVAEGNTADFTVSASNVLSYLWYVSEDGIKWTAVYPDQTWSLSISEDSIWYDYQFRCELTGYGGTTLTTNIVRILRPEEEEVTNE